jgi:hypothetical protein
MRYGFALALNVHAERVGMEPRGRNVPVAMVVGDKPKSYFVAFPECVQYQGGRM